MHACNDDSTRVSANGQSVNITVFRCGGVSKAPPAGADTVIIGMWVTLLLTVMFLGHALLIKVMPILIKSFTKC